MNFKHIVIASAILGATGAASAQSWGAPAAPARQSTGNLSGNGYVGSEMRSANGSAIYGTIEAISNATDDKSDGNLLGKFGGAILGGFAGHAVGEGNGKKLATVIGAISGAIAGNAVEGMTNKTKALTLIVKMPNGALKPYTQDDDNTVFAVGQSVIVTQVGATIRVIPAPVAGATPASTQMAPVTVTTSAN